jgi:cell division protein FtsB
MPGPVSTHDSRRATQVTLKAVTLLSSVLTIVFLVSFFFSDRGIAELQQARRRVDELETDIQKLRAENARLRGEIESAKNSTYAVEKIAREDLAMSKKGEVIYMLPAAATTSAGTSGPASPTPRP